MMMMIMMMSGFQLQRNRVRIVFFPTGIRPYDHIGWKFPRNGMEISTATFAREFPRNGIKIHFP